MAGRRTSLSNLLDGEDLDEATEPKKTPTSVRVDQCVPNPRNPRDDLGNLDDLKSIAKTQLQPCLLVTAGAYLKLWPQDKSRIGNAHFVVVNGCRRHAAATKFGRECLDVVVKDKVAETAQSFIAASIQEKIDRRDFDVIEEAKAVEDMVKACGNNARTAAKALDRTPGWVSQRRALLKLSAEMQAKLRAGDLAVRDARRLARVPEQDQVDQWRAEQEAAAEAVTAKKAFTAVNANSVPDTPTAPPEPRAAPPSRRIDRGGTGNGSAPKAGGDEPEETLTAPGDWEAPPAPSHRATANGASTDTKHLAMIPVGTPAEIANALMEHLPYEDLEALLEILNSRL